MDGYWTNKKPTIKEVANVAIENSKRINSLMGFLSELEKAFSLYIEMNKQTKTFTDFIEEKVKEVKEKQNVEKANGRPDNSNLQGDTDGEGSGSEGIRKGSW